MKQKLKNFAIMNLGILLTTLGVYFFKIPNGFSTGGVSGIAVVERNRLAAIGMHPDIVNAQRQIGHILGGIDLLEQELEIIDLGHIRRLRLRAIQGERDGIPALHVLLHEHDGLPFHLSVRAQSVRADGNRALEGGIDHIGMRDIKIKGNVIRVFDVFR